MINPDLVCSDTTVLFIVPYLPVCHTKYKHGNLGFHCTSMLILNMLFFI